MFGIHVRATQGSELHLRAGLRAPVAAPSLYKNLENEPTVILLFTFNIGFEYLAFIVYPTLLSCML